MFAAISWLMPCFMFGPDLGLSHEGPSVCAEGTAFGPEMISHACEEPIEPVHVRFDVEGEQHCATVGDAHACFPTCAEALQFAAIQVGETIDRECAGPWDDEPQQELPAVEGMENPPELPQLEATAALRLTPLPPSALEPGVQADLSIATLTSAGHHGNAVGTGFMTGLGISEGGMQFALMGGLADMTSKNWYWRMGLEVCRGERTGPWEWSGCLAVGGGELYTGQVADRHYPWASFSPSLRFHATESVVFRLDLGAQISVPDKWFGEWINGPVSVSPMATLGIQHSFPGL